MKRGVAILMILLLPMLWSFSEDTTTPKAEPYGVTEFSPWLKDLRRAEIISFGAFPFVTFFSSIYYEYYRYFQHNMASGYEPWPFTDSATEIALTEDEQKNIVLISAGISVGVAVIDYGVRAVIRLIRESQAEKHNASIPDPIRIEPIPDPSIPDAAPPPESSAAPDMSLPESSNGVQ